MFFNMFKDILWKDRNIIKGSRMYSFGGEYGILYVYSFLYFVQPL